MSNLKKANSKSNLSNIVNENGLRKSQSFKTPHELAYAHLIEKDANLELKAQPNLMHTFIETQDILKADAILQQFVTNPPIQHSVGIFWDLENCSPPTGVPGYIVVERMRQFIQPFGPILSFRVIF